MVSRVSTLTFEAWTLPSSGTYTKSFDFTPVSGAGTRELSAYQDCSIEMLASDPKTRLLAGKWIRVKLGTTYIHGFEAARVQESTDRPSRVTVSGPPLNGVLEWIATYPKNWPNDREGAQDWVWGGLGVLPPLGLGDLASIKAVYTLEIDASAGTFTLTVDGDTTEALAYNITARNLEGWATPGLQGLTTVQDVTVTGSGTSADPFEITFYNPPNPGSFTVDGSGLTGAGATLTEVTAGTLDPSPVTISKPADQQAGDPSDFGNYGTPPLEVVTDVKDTGADYSILVHALTQFAGSQVVFDVVPGETYSGTKVRVRPTASGNFAIVARTVFGDLIARKEVALTAGSFQDLTLPVWTAPAGASEAILRVAAVDSTPANIDDFYVNWQGAVVYQGDEPATPAAILNQLLEAAQARGTGDWLHVDTADNDEDSAGTALDPISFAAWFGGNAHLGHVASDLDKRGIKWRVVDCPHEIAGVTLCLEIYKSSDGTIEDLTSGNGPSILGGTPGVVVAQTAKRTSQRNVLLGHGAGKLTVEVTDSAAVATDGRRERIVDAETGADTDAVTAVLNTTIAADQANAEAASATITALNPTVPLIDYSEGSKVYWQFPGLLAKHERTVARVSWQVGQPARFEVQGSKILDPMAALTQSVNKLLNPVIRRRGGDRGPIIALPAPGADAATGAHIHLSATGSQEIGSGGGAVEWAAEVPLHAARNFTVSLPASSVPILLPGYYDIQVGFRWSGWLEGGSAWLVRTSGQVEQTVWTFDTSPVGSTFHRETAKGIELLAGDELELFVDHGDGSAQTLLSATLTVELVDRTKAVAPPAPPQIVVFTEDDEFDWSEYGDPDSVEVWVIAGGGLGHTSVFGSGGGAGGVRAGVTVNHPGGSGVTAVTVGAGATYDAPTFTAAGNSSFGDVVAVAGGSAHGDAGNYDGGSGAGRFGTDPPGEGTAGQGHDGGAGAAGGPAGGGGGGAGGPGGDASYPGLFSGRGGDAGLGIDLSWLVGTDYGDDGWFAAGGYGSGDNFGEPAPGRGAPNAGGGGVPGSHNEGDDGIVIVRIGG